MTPTLMPIQIDIRLQRIYVLLNEYDSPKKTSQFDCAGGSKVRVGAKSESTKYESESELDLKKLQLIFGAKLECAKIRSSPTLTRCHH